MHRTSRKLALVVAATALPALVVGGAALAALDKGTLPTAAFSYTSTLTNSVDIAAAGLPVVASPAAVATPASSAADATIGLQAKGSVTVKTTFSTAPTNAPFEFGWHYHNGPVIITVTTGTLTYYDDDLRAMGPHRRAVLHRGARPGPRRQGAGRQERGHRRGRVVHHPALSRGRQRPGRGQRSLQAVGGPTLRADPRRHLRVAGVGFGPSGVRSCGRARPANERDQDRRPRRSPKDHPAAQSTALGRDRPLSERIRRVLPPGAPKGGPGRWRVVVMVRSASSVPGVPAGDAPKRPITHCLVRAECSRERMSDRRRHTL